MSTIYFLAIVRRLDTASDALRELADLTGPHRAAKKE